MHPVPESLDPQFAVAQALREKVSGVNVEANMVELAHAAISAKKVEVYEDITGGGSANNTVTVHFADAQSSMAFAEAVRAFMATNYDGTVDEWTASMLNAISDPIQS